MGDCDEPNELEREDVQRELREIREEVEGQRYEDLAADINSGDWFAKLLASALRTYAEKATPEFFAKKYPGLPTEAVVDRQVALAKRYAGIEGGLTASAYTALVAKTIGERGGKSPWTVPAALTTFAVDLFYVTRLQLRLAYDMGVLYGKPWNMDDPEDVYELLTVAFGVKATEVAMSAVNKAAPELVRQGIKRIVSGGTLKWLQGLPVIGQYILQRNVIKFGIPLVGIPLSAGMNYWTTGAIAKAARQIFRDKAVAGEQASRFADYSVDDALMVSVVWAATRADDVIKPEEMWLLTDMVRLAEEAEGLPAEGRDLGFDVDVESLFAKVAGLEPDERDILFEAACFAVTFDRKVHKKEREFLDGLSSAAGISWDPERLNALVRANKV